MKALKVASAYCNRRCLKTLILNVKHCSQQRHFSSCDADNPKNVAAMRKPYKGKQDVFDVEALVAKEPYAQFYAWFEEAKKTDGIMEANAMAIATATKDGKPSVRMVLMKGIDKKGIVFYTNYLSKKASDLAENPHCSLMFYWEPLMKSVRVEGSVERVSQEESEQYFHSRPRTSQMGACVSLQSQRIKNRQVLDDRNDELLQKYDGNDIPIPKPDHWGGYRVKPHRFEFWQGQTNRLHDRIVFRRQDDGEVVDASVTHQGDEGWLYERLMP